MDNPRSKSTAYLTQIYGENTNRKFKLACDKVTIGRKLQADIRLQNPNISRNHCVLNYTENGWTITDKKSQNGTYISGRKLTPGETRLLQCGDIIFLGPPSEMPEAFCYDDAFVDDEDIPESGHEIIELPPVKRPVEEKMTASKKVNSLKESTDVESNKVASSSIDNGHINKIQSASKPREIANITKYNDEMCNKEKVFLHKNEILSITNYKSSSELKVADIEGRMHHVPYNKMPSSMDSPPSKQSKLDNSDSGCDMGVRMHHVPYNKMPSSMDSFPFKQSKLDSDSGYQINEISSTADDKSEDSMSLLDVEKNEASVPSCSNSMDVRTSPMLVENSQTSTETDLLRDKLALLSEHIKNLEKSKLDLLKNYEVVCEKNFALDQQLADKKKLEDNLKCKEDNLKNELLEKLEEDLICNICTELLIKPTVLDCSHTFCLYCIKEWKKKKNECPMCRHKIQNMTPVLTLEHFIDKTLATFTPEQKERRSQLIKERENPPKKAVTPTLKRGRGGRGYRRRHHFRHPTVSTINRHIMAAPPRDDIEIIAERTRPILPIPVAPLTLPTNVYIRLPDLLDNSRDSFSLYLA